MITYRKNYKTNFNSLTIKKKNKILRESLEKKKFKLITKTTFQFRKMLKHFHGI